ncbi:unnamed protein product [Absidia cylindrospora]
MPGLLSFPKKSTDSERNVEALLLTMKDQSRALLAIIIVIAQILFPLQIKRPDYVIDIYSQLPLVLVNISTQGPFLGLGKYSFGSTQELLSFFMHYRSSRY